MGERSDEEKRGIGPAMIQAALEGVAGEVEEFRGETPLFPVDRRPDDAADGSAAAVEGGVRRPGRPPGSRNKNTGAFRSYILSQFGDPAAMLARRNMMNLDQLKALAMELGCKPIELFRAQNDALARLMPYVHSPQPTAVKVEGVGAMAMVSFGVPLDGQAGDSEHSGTEWEVLEAMAARIGEDREQKQGVTVIDHEASNVPVPNVDANSEGKSDG